MTRPLRILVAHSVSRQRTGGMSRLMSFAHDQLVAAGHSVDYFCAEDIPGWQKGQVARFGFPFMAFQHARRAAANGQRFDVVNIHEPSAAAVTWLKSMAGSPRVVVMSY